MAVRYEQLKKQLLSEKSRLEEELDQISEAPGASVGCGNHMADDATIAYEQTKALAVKQNAKWLLVQVKEALERFEEGTFGVCENCGQSIDPARLKAIPYTALCMSCAQGQTRR
jgi:RNA polymerase-binding protein DksA